MRSVSVVCVLHDSAPDLEVLLDSIDRHLDRRPELVVVDTGSADDGPQIAALRAAQSREQTLASARMASQSRAPLIEQQIANVQQELTGLNTQYQDVQQRLTLARAGVKAEDEQIAERLTVVEPPVIPDQPAWPNRLIILALCIGGGLGLGIVLALAMELFFRPIRDPDSLATIMGEGPLAVVPVLGPRPDQRKKGLRRFGFGRLSKT